MDQKKLKELLEQSKGGSFTAPSGANLGGLAGSMGGKSLDIGWNPYRDVGLILPHILAQSVSIAASQETSEIGQKAIVGIYGQMLNALAAAQVRPSSGVSIMYELFQAMGAEDNPPEAIRAYQLITNAIVIQLFTFLFSSKAVAMDIEKIPVEDLVRQQNIFQVLELLPEDVRSQALQTLNTMGELPCRIAVSDIRMTADEVKQIIKEHGRYGRKDSDGEQSEEDKGEGQGES
jgi:hypothetical protein